jgi:hypothetical protein
VKEYLMVNFYLYYLIIKNIFLEIIKIKLLVIIMLEEYTHFGWLRDGERK